MCTSKNLLSDTEQHPDICQVNRLGEDIIWIPQTHKVHVNFPHLNEFVTILLQRILFFQCLLQLVYLHMHI